MITIQQTYFYHAKTRETSWSKPENVKVVTQTELESLVSSHSTASLNGVSAQKECEEHETNKAVVLMLFLLLLGSVRLR